MLVLLLVPITLRLIALLEIYSLAMTGLMVLGTTLVIVLHFNIKWHDQLRPFALAFDRGIGFTAAMILFYIFMLGVSFALNPLFGLSQINSETSFTQLGVQILTSIPLGIFAGWFVNFGEKYSWRYYLQHRLFNLLGGVRGVLLLGVIWGLWHAPVIAMGYNYTGEPLMGVITITPFTLVIGIFYSYAVMRTGCVWPAVILHGINNSIAPMLVRFFGEPASRVYAFGIGLFGIALMGLLAAWFLKQIWAGKMKQPEYFSFKE